MRRPMLQLARWHIWLGWIVGLPILMWTVTGLFMTAKPIEEVRGSHLRIEQPAAMLPMDELLPMPEMDDSIQQAQLSMQRGVPVWRVTYESGKTARIDARSGTMLPELTEQDARDVVRQSIEGGDAVSGITAFPADNVPFDFRRPIPVWQVALDDGTHVYVGQQTGEIEAVRTRWWRWFDFMWGLHILDPVEREDTSHPLLIGLALFSVIGSMMGCILLFRRRKAARHRAASRGA